MFKRVQYPFHGSKPAELFFKVMFSSIIGQSTYKQSAVRIAPGLLVVGWIIILDAVAQKLLNASGLCGSVLFLCLLCCISWRVVLVMLSELREKLCNA